jgi:hypothetical protein
MIVAEIVESMKTMLNVHISVPRMRREEFSTQILLKTKSWVVICNQNTNRQRVSQTADKTGRGFPTQKKKRWTGFPKQQNK